MALTTRAAVLQRLGVTDDAASSGAISVGRKTATTATIATTSTQLTVSINGGAATAYTLSSAANDTLSELIAVVNAAHTEIELELVAGVSGSTSSSLLDASQSIALSSSNGTGVLTYSNTANGTVAALIDDLISETDAYIAGRCDRFVETTGAEAFSYQSWDEYLDGDGYEYIQLTGYPVTSVTSITLVDSSGAVTSTLTSGTDYQIDMTRGRVRWLGGLSDLVFEHPVSSVGWGGDAPATNRVRVGWPRGFRNIRVQYTGGYATIPADLKGAATQIVVDKYLNRRRNFLASSQSLAGSAQVSFVDSMEYDDRYETLFATYRKVSA